MPLLEIRALPLLIRALPLLEKVEEVEVSAVPLLEIRALPLSTSPGMTGQLQPHLSTSPKRTGRRKIVEAVGVVN